MILALLAGFVVLVVLKLLSEAPYITECRCCHCHTAKQGIPPTECSYCGGPL